MASSAAAWVVVDASLPYQSRVVVLRPPRGSVCVNEALCESLPVTRNETGSPLASLLHYPTPHPRAQGGTMSALSRDAIRTMMADVLQAQGKPMPEDDSADLEGIGFRSLDFSELALRVEDEIGDELNFDAPELRQIATISDVLDFLEQLQAA